MIELKQSPVVFTDNPHGYHLAGKRLSGITSLIHQVLGLGNYPGASDYVHRVKIPEAGAYGTAVHHAIETYDQLGIAQTTQWVVWRERKPYPSNAEDYDREHEDYFEVSRELEAYIRHKVGYQAIANEYTVSDEERYASNIDNVWLKTDTQGIWLVDTKTNNLDYYPGGADALKEYLSWQLSCYACLFERQNPGLKVEGLACNWLRKGEGEFWVIGRKEDEAVWKLLATEWALIDGRIVYDGADFPKPQAVAKAEESQALVPRQIVEAIYELEKTAKETEAKSKQMKAKLREAMENAGVRVWDADLFRATLSADSVATTFDAKRFKEDHPELYKQYTTQTAKKGGFTIKLKEQ